MGIRIHKDIGYFLPNEDLDKILVSNYSEVLENLDENDDAEKNFFHNLITSMQESTNDDVTQILNKLTAKSYLEKIKKNELSYYHLVSQITFGDDDEGVLFRTYDHYKNSRYDDLIDYYECSPENSIKYLYSAIYPNQGFIYKGGIIDEKIIDAFANFNKPLVVGQTQEYFYVKILLAQLGFNLDLPEGEVSKAIVDSGLFYPKVDNALYLTAKAANILQPHVTKEIFDSLVKPAILTYWA